MTTRFLYNDNEHLQIMAPPVFAAVRRVRWAWLLGALVVAHR